MSIYKNAASFALSYYFDGDDVDFIIAQTIPNANFRKVLYAYKRFAVRKKYSGPLIAGKLGVADITDMETLMENSDKSRAPLTCFDPIDHSVVGNGCLRTFREGGGLERIGTDSCDRPLTA